MEAPAEEMNEEYSSTASQKQQIACDHADLIGSCFKYVNNGTVRERISVKNGINPASKL